ncbi:MAG: MmgE/PrpD family protein [Candidatus Korarchaeota archaeon]|nr:MmgE/PrpD family protein [Candidatus Korarchaeota archaeon]
MEVARIETPTSLEEALFSLKFLVATSLLYGSLGLDSIERALNDPKVREIEHKVKVLVDMELSSRFPSEQPALVRVKSNGK